MGAEERMSPMKELSMEETWTTLNSMDSFKATGPDGYHSVFFKRTQQITGSALYSVVRNILERGSIPEEAADALLILIPKDKQPINVMDFCQ